MTEFQSRQTKLNTLSNLEKALDDTVYNYRINNSELYKEEQIPYIYKLWKSIRDLRIELGLPLIIQR